MTSETCKNYKKQFRKFFRLDKSQTADHRLMTHIKLSSSGPGPGHVRSSSEVKISDQELNYFGLTHRRKKTEIQIYAVQNGVYIHRNKVYDFLWFLVNSYYLAVWDDMKICNLLAKVPYKFVHWPSLSLIEYWINTEWIFLKHGFESDFFKSLEVYF